MDKPMKCFIRVRLLRSGDDQKTAFGPGPARLLRGIEKTGSLNQSAKAMGMAYSKAWKVLGAVESQLGFPLIERKGPKGSSLTDRGRRFLALYSEIEKAVNDAAQKVLDNTDFTF
jgi:molybdate transport system regulatory protein